MTSAQDISTPAVSHFTGNSSGILVSNSFIPPDGSLVGMQIAGEVWRLRLPPPPVAPPTTASAWAESPHQCHLKASSLTPTTTQALDLLRLPITRTSVIPC